MKWLFIISIILCSCASQKPKYQPSTAPVQAPAPTTKQRTQFQVNFCMFLLTGFCFYVMDKESN